MVWLSNSVWSKNIKNESSWVRIGLLRHRKKYNNSSHQKFLYKRNRPAYAVVVPLHQPTYRPVINKTQHKTPSMIFQNTCPRNQLLFQFTFAPLKIEHTIGWDKILRNKLIYFPLVTFDILPSRTSGRMDYGWWWWWWWWWRWSWWLLHYLSFDCQVLNK